MAPSCRPNSGLWWGYDGEGKAFEQIGGFDPSVIAAEDDEFCTRLRKAGWLLERLPVQMTRHDAAMLSFGQWWQRAVRTGHGFAQVGHLHPEYFSRERQRVWLYGLAVPLAGLVLALIWWPLLFLALGAYVLNWRRTALGLQRDGLERKEAFHQSVFLTLSKFPNLIGIVTFYHRLKRGAAMQLIEYK